MKTTKKDKKKATSQEETLKTFLNPKSVAVIGASRREGAVGHEIVRNLLRHKYPGKIFPINPNASEILGLKCYPSTLDVKEKIDLGVVAVPAEIVPIVAKEAGQKNIKGLIVISAGFKEVGLEGLEREKELLKICKRHQMSLLGPNCLGLINTTTPLNASFAPQMPPKGNIAFMSQSGALCTAVLDWAESEHIGFSTIVSLGNMADMNETSFMELLAEDPNTKVILVYVEGIKEGKRFLSVAPATTRKKPVIFLKSGTSNAGARAAASHTGSIAGSQVAYTEAFRRCGVLRANTIEELFNLGIAFSSQPIPRGRNVAIITNAGGPSIVAADACSQHELNLAWLSPQTVDLLRKNLPQEASWFNPVDVLGDAAADRYSVALETVLADDSVESVLVILTPQAMTEPLETAKKIEALRSNVPDKPIIAIFMGGERIRKAIEALMKAGIPNYPQPDKGVFTLAGMVQYGEYLSREPEAFPSFDVDRGAVKRVLERVRRERRVSLLSVEAREVVQAYGITVPPSGLAQNRRQAIRIAEKIGYPVAMKVVSPQILHKTDIGGVKLNISSERGVEVAFNEIIMNANLFMPGAHVFGVEVHKMVPAGKEMIVGMNRDVQFGPLIMFGLGGVYVNVLRDVSFRLAPISKRATSEMITETKSYALLRGVRGEPSSDIESVVDVILRVSKLSTDFKEINEIDINPLFVYERGKGSLALDVKITVTNR